MATADRQGMLCVWDAAGGGEDGGRGEPGLQLVAYRPPKGGGTFAGGKDLRGLAIVGAGGADVAGHSLVYSEKDGLLMRWRSEADDPDLIHPWSYQDKIRSR